MPDGGESKPVAVVTGGNGFIGSAIVCHLVASGHDVVVVDREGEFSADLATEADVRRVARRVLAEYGRCDVLVHAAVAFERSTLDQLDASLLRTVMAVNVEAPLWLMQEFTPGMKARGFGRGIFLVSDTFWDPPAVSDMLPYITSKGALIGAARSLARSLGADGITVNCVAPGMTPPPIPEPGLGKDIADGVVRRQALPRSLVPDDVAVVVAFLATPGAQAVTGQSICPDGGLVLR
ncbi:MAG: SDR family oxidoreductase [Actinomycetota bacterium]|nr:SDR family oxidoreductase [Actinomycetota bacterium]